ncbi:MAG: YwaF family protein [Erysipelotrichaceae bacterium]
MFWLTTQSVKNLYGENYTSFTLFSPVHLFWLFIAIVLTVLIFKYYSKLNQNTRRKILISVTVLLIADELFKDIPCLLTHQFEWDHLPFHLCSVNIFTALLNTIKPNRITKTLLTTICIPAALCALVMPTWVCLPIFNFMHIHSFTVHILLFIYPMFILAEGFRPEYRDFPCIVAYIIALTLIDKIINRLLNTNFLFLEFNENNPALILLENLTGNFYNLGIVLFLFVFSLLMITIFKIIPEKVYTE